MLESLASAFHALADAIAFDWSSPGKHQGVLVSLTRPTTPDDVRGMFVEFAAVRYGIEGTLHPERFEQVRLFGHWTM